MLVRFLLEVTAMKLRLVMGGLLAMVFSIVTYAAEPREVTVAVSIDELMSRKHINRQVEIPAGGLLSVTLGSNPTTGFRWSKTASIGDGTVLRQMSHKYLASDSPREGAPGNEVWVVQTMKEGTSTVTMSYSRPWAGGEKEEWTFSLKVIVK
jgi:inhibitor of cysteine peptidase